MEGKDEMREMSYPKRKHQARTLETIAGTNSDRPHAKGKSQAFGGKEVRLVATRVNKTRLTKVVGEAQA